MNSAMCFLLLIALLLCGGSAWGKAVGLEGQEGEGIVQAGWGKAVGLEKEGIVQATPAPRNQPCLYKGNVFTIDVRNIASRFNKMKIPSPDGAYVYFLSLCSPIICDSGKESSEADETAAGCQYIPAQDYFLRLGSESSYQWTIVNTTYFYIVFNNGDPFVDGSGTRHLQVAFKFNNDCTKEQQTMAITFDEQEYSSSGYIITYKFTIAVNGAKSDVQEFLSLNDDFEF